MRTQLKLKLLKLRYRCGLAKGTPNVTFTMKNGVAVSIACFNLEKFRPLREMCAHKYGLVENVIREARVVTCDNVALYTALSTSTWKCQNTYVITFNLPSTSIYALFKPPKLGRLIGQLASMHVGKALRLCDVIVFNNEAILNNDADAHMILNAIRHNLDLPVARLIYA
jgi:hypothetical protein